MNWRLIFLHRWHLWPKARSKISRHVPLPAGGIPDDIKRIGGVEEMGYTYAVIAMAVYQAQL
jgi:hypothetical protein